MLSETEGREEGKGGKEHHVSIPASHPTLNHLGLQVLHSEVGEVCGCTCESADGCWCGR